MTSYQPFSATCLIFSVDIDTAYWSFIRLRLNAVEHFLRNLTILLDQYSLMSIKSKFETWIWNVDRMFYWNGTFQTCLLWNTYTNLQFSTYIIIYAIRCNATLNEGFSLSLSHSSRLTILLNTGSRLCSLVGNQRSDWVSSEMMWRQFVISHVQGD